MPRKSKKVIINLLPTFIKAPENPYPTQIKKPISFSSMLTRNSIDYIFIIIFNSMQIEGKYLMRRLLLGGSPEDPEIVALVDYCCGTKVFK